MYVILTQMSYKIYLLVIFEYSCNEYVFGKLIFTVLNNLKTRLIIFFIIIFTIKHYFNHLIC